jgi:hypothetical protein
MNIIFGSILVIAATCLQTFAPRVIGAFIAGRGIIGFAQGVALRKSLFGPVLRETLLSTPQFYPPGWSYADS